MKPMLAATLEDASKIRFPVLSSPKLDGIRCLIINGVAMSRSLKPIPNRHVQSLFGKARLDGFDGELIVGPPGAKDVYNQTTSGVMARDYEPDVKFFAFDDFSDAVFGDLYPFHLRYNLVKKKMIGLDSLPMTRVEHTMINNMEQLDAYEADCLEKGFEGVMIRDPNGLYKQGRSTVREGGLLKVKRFEDSEAVILGVVEQMQNNNEAKRNALGHLERSSHKANKSGKGVLGALQVRDLKTGVEFEIGTGFNDEQRSRFWSLREVDLQNGYGWHPNPGETYPKNPGNLFGRIVKYKFQPVGVKEKPRFPVFLGFRNPIDMS